MDKDFYDFYCNLFKDEVERKIIKLMLENKDDEEALELLIKLKEKTNNV